MADALCGPSNALQSFRKHTQVDRTLQQDRLVGRHSPAQGFRTQDPRTGALDAALHEFEHAPTNPFQFQQPPPQFAQPSPQTAQGPALGGWAADFQRLHISNSPSPIPVQQFRAEAPLVRSSPSLQAGPNVWHDEFMQHHYQGKGKEVAQQPQYNPTTSIFSQQPSYAMGNQPYLSSFQQPSITDQTSSIPHQQVDADSAAYEAAFEEAMQLISQDTQQTSQDQDLTSETLLSDQAPNLDSLSPQQQIRIGSDAIDYHSETDTTDRTPEQTTREADDLARTAGHLLTLVSHDTSSKFQNSQFLDLMRRIRDREVEVQNNDLQSTAPTARTAEGLQPISQITEQPPLQQAQSDPAATSAFSFPDLNSVYAPTQADVDTSTYPASSWQGSTAWADGSGRASDADAMYTVGADEYPSGGQNADLHPGGRWYPEQKSPEMQSRGMGPA